MAAVKIPVFNAQADTFTGVAQVPETERADTAPAGSRRRSARAEGRSWIHLVTASADNAPLRLVTVPVLLLVATAAVLAALTLNVVAGHTKRVDQPVLDWMVDHRSAALTSAMRTVSDLGGGAAMTLVALTVSVALLWFGHRLPALFVVVAGIGGSWLSYLGKRSVGRARPPVADHLVEVTNPAFPSGHSLGSFVVVGAVTIVVVSLLRTRRARLAVAIPAAIFVLAVGLSRLYLGVHWTTDVLGGWLLGALWLGICLLGYRRMEIRWQRRTQVSSADEPRIEGAA